MREGGSEREADKQTEKVVGRESAMVGSISDIEELYCTFILN